jgi:hypothetical protein
MAMRSVADPGVQRFEEEAVIHLGALPGTASKMTGVKTEAEGLVLKIHCEPLDPKTVSGRAPVADRNFSRSRLIISSINIVAENRNLRWSITTKSAGYVPEGHANETA